MPETAGLEWELSEKLRVKNEQEQARIRKKVHDELAREEEVDKILSI